MKDFSLRDLNSDISLITDIARVTTQAHRRIMKLGKIDSRKRFMYLMNRCREKQIALKVLPKCMSRHVMNGSYFDKAMETIFWEVEWHFLTRKQGEINVSVERLSEKLTMTECIRTALEHFSASAEFLYELSQMNISLDSITCAILWLREKARADEDKVMHVFVQVTPTLTLAEAVKTLYTQSHPMIEFPDFYLAPVEMLKDLIIVSPAKQ